MTQLTPANAERLRNAFQQCRDMEGTLREQLEAYAAAGREVFPAYGEAVDRLVERVHENGGGENAPRPGDAMPPFVLPDDCFGADERDILLLQSATAHEHSFRQNGTLESWQENVARYAIGNSRLVLAISAAFAGPLVGPCSAEGGGLHFKGASSTGKSTALHVAGSV